MVAPTSVRLVTSNPGKFREARAIFRESGLELAWSRRALPELQADSLEEVVQSKLAALAPSRSALVVEDSGLFLPALGGFPGVYSAYVYRTLGTDGLLRLLRGRDRAAVYRTVAGVRRGLRVQLFPGECRGKLVARARGTAGFGFDPIFEPSGASRTFAEMDLRTKNQYSHRGSALRQLAGTLAHPGRTPP